MVDCQHWISAMLEAERKEYATLERENRELRHKLADIANIAKGVDRPTAEWSIVSTGYPQFRGQQPSALLQQERLRPRQNIFDGLLGGGGWPWC